MNFLQRIDPFLDFKLARNILAGLSAAVLLFIPIDGVRIQLQTAPREKHLSSVSRLAEKKTFEPAASYLALFEKNTLFGDGTLTAAAPVLKASLTELIKDYRLKGIILMEEPEVIIEDARTQKTQFLKAGGRLGDLTIQEIRESAIVLSYLGEEIQLEIQS